MLRRKPTRLTLNDADQEEFQKMAEEITQQVGSLALKWVL
jgi:hypothetical protein